MRFLFERIFDLSFDLKKKKTPCISKTCVYDRNDFLITRSSLRYVIFNIHILSYILSQGTND